MTAFRFFLKGLNTTADKVAAEPLSGLIVICSACLWIPPLLLYGTIRTVFPLIKKYT